MKDLHYGEGYVYAHDTEEKLTRMQCLPDALSERLYYRHTQQGEETAVKERLEEIRKWRKNHWRFCYIMSNVQLTKYKKIFFLLAAAGLILLLACSIFLCIGQRRPGEYSDAVAAMLPEKYQSVFVSMYDISTFAEEDFTTYRGIPTSRLTYTPNNAGQLTEVLATVFSSGNHITNIYLGLDPLLLGLSGQTTQSGEEASNETEWLTYVDSHPRTTFEVLLPFPSMEYWLSLSQEDLDTSMSLYQRLAGLLISRSNVTVYYVGGQEWLTNNPANYISSYVTNEIISQKIFLLTFCDHTLQLTADNMEEEMQRTYTRILANREHPITYPDFSSWQIVFIGDSIIGNSEGSFSVPGVVNGLTGAVVYNCAESGVSAAQPSGTTELCFPTMADDFVNGTATVSESTYEKGIQEYQASDHTNPNLCFILNFGLNDYFCGYPTENPDDHHDISTYAGSLRTGIATLKEKYPDAIYVIMGPGRTTYFENGVQPQSEGGGSLADYYYTVRSLANEQNCFYIDLYNGFPDREGDTLSDILADGCHYNEYGRYSLGIKIIRSLSDLF